MNFLHMSQCFPLNENVDFLYPSNLFDAAFP
jgi:hypothetical protein